MINCVILFYKLRFNIKLQQLIVYSCYKILTCISVIRYTMISQKHVLWHHLLIYQLRYISLCQPIIHFWLKFNFYFFGHFLILCWNFYIQGFIWQVKKQQWGEGWRIYIHIHAILCMWRMRECVRECPNVWNNWNGEKIVFFSLCDFEKPLLKLTLLFNHVRIVHPLWFCCFFFFPCLKFPLWMRTSASRYNLVKIILLIWTLFMLPLT